MKSDERWLAAMWPFVRASVPAAPSGVVEIGCGPLGGFVPMLRSAGYDAVGIDLRAPEGPWYRQQDIEAAGLPPGGLGAVVACVSLHHVADLAVVLDRIEAALMPGGKVVIVEWARERFDEATARWCFDRLPADDREHAEDHEHGDHEHGDHQHGAEHEHGVGNWLARHWGEWGRSGQPWADYCTTWAEAEGMHEGRKILAALDERFDRQSLVTGPYYFADLATVSEADEQAAIDAGQIQANRIQYVGQRRL